MLPQFAGLGLLPLFLLLGRRRLRSLRRICFSALGSRRICETGQQEHNGAKSVVATDKSV